MLSLVRGPEMLSVTSTPRACVDRSTLMMGSIFTGLKIAVTLAVVGAVVAEIVAGRDGLGYLLLFASSRLDMSFSLGILLVLAAWGALLFATVELVDLLVEALSARLEAPSAPAISGPEPVASIAAPAATDSPSDEPTDTTEVSSSETSI